MESQQVWITLKADDKKEIEKLLSDSPLFKYFTFTIDELYVLDGQNYRLPALQFN
jgi:muconolactone delta-isomerase